MSTEKSKLNIIFEDDYILAINKPAGVPVQATHSRKEKTVLDLIDTHYKSRGYKQYISLIHRLDKGTTGVMLLSKSTLGNKALTDAFRDKSVQKEYVAIATGTLEHASGTIETAIKKVRGSHTKYECVESGGKHALSRYELVDKLKGHSLVRILPETGRTHQIRVHMSHIGHPILGDRLYGGRERLLVKTKSGNIKHFVSASAQNIGSKSEPLPGNHLDGGLVDKNVKRVMLHAGSLTIAHPHSKQTLTLKAELPDDMTEIINILK